jgi:tRNA G10  N-methylase Trm11
MKYIFHLGRIPALSLAEIQAILEKIKATYTATFIDQKFLILDIKNEIDFKELLPQMGGTIKIAEVLEEHRKYGDIFKNVVPVIEKSEKKRSGRKNIGYSIYFTPKEDRNKVLEISKEIKTNFIRIKKDLSKKSSIRIIFPDKNLELKSISVIKNKILENGLEFNFIFLNKKIILSKTIATQDIESYSSRDYGRPKREPRIGMIPPKLSQIMINLAQIKESQVVLDPFCGIGTILQEALLNDYKVIGSDANAKQVLNSKENLKWLSRKYIIKYPDYRIFQSDIGSISRKIKPNSIDAIVTESILGPVYKKIPRKIEIRQNYNRFEKTYSRFFQIAKTVLRKRSKIVVTIPAYKIKADHYIFAPFIDKLEKIGYSIVCPLDKKFIIKDIKVTDRNSITYDRPDQIVAREVFVFENK